MVQILILKATFMTQVSIVTRVQMLLLQVEPEKNTQVLLHSMPWKLILFRRKILQVMVIRQS